MEVFIQDFDKVVNGFQVSQVVVIDINTNAEVESSVSSIDNLEVSKLNKVGMLGISNGDHSVDFFNQFLLLVIVKIHIPLG